MTQFQYFADWFSIPAIGDGREKIWNELGAVPLSDVAIAISDSQTSPGASNLSLCHFRPSVDVFNQEVAAEAEILGIPLDKIFAQNRQHFHIPLNLGLGDTHVFWLRQIRAEIPHGHILSAAELTATPHNYYHIECFDGPTIWPSPWPTDRLGTYLKIIIADQFSLGQITDDTQIGPNLMQQISPSLAATIMHGGSGDPLQKNVRHQETANYLQAKYGATALFSPNNYTITNNTNIGILLYHSSKIISFGQIKTEHELATGADSFFLLAYNTFI